MFATNHKDIGTLYLLFSFTMLIIGGILALLIRAELFQPGLQLVNPELFNPLTTMSRVPVASAPTMGRAQAIASDVTLPKVSVTLGCSSKSAEATARPRSVPF